MANLAHKIVAAIVVAAFMVCGLRGMRAGGSHRTEGSGNLSSTDAYLGQVLQTHAAGEAILDAMAKLPADAPVAILALDDDPFAPALLQEIGSITWPHPIFLVLVNEKTLDDALAKLRRDGVAMAMFYRIPAPEGARVGTLNLVMVPK